MYDANLETHDITSNDYEELRRLIGEIEEKLNELTTTRGIAIAKTKTDELRMWVGYAYFEE